VIADGGAQLRECDREIRVLHLPREGPLELLAQASGRVDVPLIAGCEERCKERKALDVVPMSVGDHQVTAYRPGCGERETEAVRAGAAVEDDERPGRRPYLDTRSVATVPHCGRPGLASDPRVPQNRLACRIPSAG
jgi:hypothetical protein